MGPGPQPDDDDVAQRRAAPILYVVDAQLDVMFSSHGTVERPLPAPLRDALGAAVADVKAGGRHTGLFEGRLVRAEVLVGTDGRECYAVFFEPVS